MRSPVWILLVPFVLMSAHASGQVTVSSFELGGHRFGSYPRDTTPSTVKEPTFDRERFHPEVSVHGGFEEEETTTIEGIDVRKMELYYGGEGLYRILLGISPDLDLDRLIQLLEDRYQISLNKRYGGFVYTGDRIKIEVVHRSGPEGARVIFSDTERQRKIEQDLLVLRTAIRRLRAEAVHDYFEAQYEKPVRSKPGEREDLGTPVVRPSDDGPPPGAEDDS